MNRKNVITFKIVTLILLILILFTSIYIYTNHFEVTKNNIYKKVYNTNSIDGVIKNKNLKKYKFNKNIIYISRHDGTIANFSNIAEFLSFNVTVLKPDYQYAERPNCYKKDKCRSYVDLICSKYDFVVVSDIIPDSFIYYINYCKAKLILEVTNRFDIFVKQENKEEYYKLFGKAVTENKNVIVVENNPFEVFHACQRKVFIPNYYLVRSIGYAPLELLNNKNYKVYDEIAIIQLNYQDKNIIVTKLDELKVKYEKLPYKYGGPLALAFYKAIIILPYQVSIMETMENFRYGVAMIVPSERLFRELLEDNRYIFSAKNLKDIPEGIKKYVEFYHDNFKDLFVYFDKWEDLTEIIEKTDFNKVKEKGKEFIQHYEKYALNIWAQALELIPPDDIIRDKQPICDNTDFYNYKHE